MNDFNRTNLSDIKNVAMFSWRNRKLEQSAATKKVTEFIVWFQWIRAHQYQWLATIWNAIRAVTVPKSVVHIASVRQLVRPNYRKCRFAEATDRRTTTSASYVFMPVVIRLTWWYRPSVTVEVGLLSVHLTCRFTFCATKKKSTKTKLSFHPAIIGE